MFILQISDLHISTDSDVDLLSKKIEALTNCLSEMLKAEDSLLCCLLGDFVDQGNAEAFPIAKRIIQKLKQNLAEILLEGNLAFEVVPGNHDLCGSPKSLHKFNQFASTLFEKEIAYSSECPVIVSDHFGFHFIMLNSVLQGYKYGSVDLDNLKGCSISPKTIVMVHHALVSSTEDDDACIRKGYELQEYLEDHHIVSLLHGHTHGCKRYTVGQDCQVIGVGPMFKDVADISNQCNLIKVEGNSVTQIHALIYQGDRKSWDAVGIYQKQEDNSYTGISVYDVYTHLVHDFEGGKTESNLRIQVKQPYDAFEKEIKECFSAALEEAEKWQSDLCPDDLPYTHAMYMNDPRVPWDKYIIGKLKENNSSKRAIIPLIDKTMVYGSEDGHLVSFDIVQFGFANSDCTNLYITIYFRALEVFHFLPINLCEAYLMAKKIREDFPSIQTLTVCFFAFRADAKTQYGCYKIAEIDRIDESLLCKLLTSAEGQIKIQHLLQQKADMCDTVINIDWVDKLQHALRDFYSSKNKDAVMEQSLVMRNSLAALQYTRKKNSDYSKTEAEEKTFVEELIKLKNMIGEIDD